MRDKTVELKTGELALNEMYGDAQSVLQIINLFIALILAGIIAGIFIVLTNNNTASAALLSAGAAAALFALVLVRRGKFESTIAFIAVFLILLNTVLSTRGLGVHSINNIAYPAILIIGSLVVNKRIILFLTVLTILCIGWLVFGELNGWYTVDTLVRSVPGDFFSAALIVIMTAVMSRRLTDTLYRGFLRLRAEVEERKKLEENLRQREAVFEAVAFAAERFLKTPDWRGNMDEALERLGGAIHASHAYIFEKHRGPGNETLDSMRFEWTAPGHKSELSNPDFQNMASPDPGFESYYRTLESGDAFIGNTSTFLPLEREYFSSVGIKAILEMPLFVDGIRWGTIGFDDCERERVWDNAEMDALKIARGIISAAIQREKADSAVQESERIYRQAIEAAGAVPYFQDYAGNRYTFMSGGIERITGYQREEFTPQVWEQIALEIIPLGETEGLDQREAVRLLRSGKFHQRNSDNRVLSKDGRERWISDSAVELLNKDGAAFASVGILQDITERKTTEFNLRRHESLLESITFAAGQFLKSDDWHETIDAVLQRLGREFNASHAYLFEKHTGADNTPLLSMTHEWVAAGQANDLELPQYQNMPSRARGFDRLYDILDSGEPLVGSASFFTNEERAYMHSIGVRALLEIRMVVNGAHWGTLGFDDTVNEREWQPMEVDAIKVAAGVLGAAVERQLNDDKLKAELAERQRLIHELERKNAEAETLRETTEIITTTLDISEAVNHILIQLKRVVRYDSASVWLFEEEAAHQIGADGLPPQASLVKRHTLNPDEPDYPLWEEGLPYVLLEDVQERYEKFRRPPLDYIHGWLAIPLRARGRFTGFIALDGKQKGQFSSHDAHLALTYANQVAIALENARLFSDLQAELSQRQSLIGKLEEKNSELERFTYTVSHDLKSPLVTIAGFLNYIEQDVASGNMKRFQTDLQRVRAAVGKMQQLLMELLELSRIGRIANPPVEVPFEELVHDALETVHGRLEADRVRVVVEPGLPVVFGDKPRLVEVLQNLIENAAKYMGGQKEPLIEIGARVTGDAAPVFYVKDNGIGIPPEHHNRIFELFTKLDADSEGTGVGLSLVKRIIEVHGGRIWVESGAGRGSTFYFTLPVIPGTSP